MPGDNVEMVCELVHDVAAEAGSRFTLREGGKTSKLYIYSTSPKLNSRDTVGTGIVTKILEYA